MIDLETLATTNDANVLTIGAIKFDPHEDYSKWQWLEFPETQTFYRRVEHKWTDACQFYLPITII